MAITHNDPMNLGRLFKREPSLTQCRLYRLFWMLAYVGLFAMKDSLPDRFGRDAETLAEMVQTGNFDEGSYGAMAAIYSYVPAPLLPFLPLAICLPSLWIIMGYVRSYAIMMLLPILMLPYLIMNFMNPTKETLVALMALIIYRISQSHLSTFKATGLIILIYGAYAAGVRSYYAMILAFFLGFLMVKHLPRAFTVVGIVIVLGVMAFLPASVYEAIQGPRDEAALYMSRMSEYVRTFFFNLMEPQDMLSFFVNTFWGVLVMYMPLFIAQSFNEVLMMINVYCYTGMVIALLRYRKGAAQLPAYLFLGHVLTQAQFEPDLGSYVRHFSSILTMLAPGMYFMFRNRPAEQILAEDGELDEEDYDEAEDDGAPVSTSLTTAR